MDPISKALVLLLATMAMAAAGVSGDFAADQAECSDKLASLATCLTYVQEQATAAAPTLDCCAGLKSVLQTSRKCLCVLVKDRDNPNLGLKINVNKALGLPQVCKASANISDCPGTSSLDRSRSHFLSFSDSHVLPAIGCWPPLLCLHQPQDTADSN
jgi:hypothetical protein